MSDYLDASEEWAGKKPPPATPAATPAPGRQEAPLRPLQNRTGHGTVRGFARNVQLRTDNEQLQILAFRLDQYAADGSRALPVGVELYGYRGGQVGEGEEIEATGRWRDGTLRARRVVNRTTGAEIKGISMALRNLVMGFFLALILGFIAFVAYMMITGP